MSVPMGLIGRDQEIAAAEVVLESLSDAPRVIAIAGEPGIGKTRLLGELSSRADQRGHLVLNGRGAEFERELPFGAFADALDDYLAAQGPRRFEILGSERLGELTQVFPALSGLGGPPAGFQDERYRTHAAVRELLALLATEQPLTLALDDLHWIDAASMELAARPSATSAPRARLPAARLPLGPARDTAGRRRRGRAARPAPHAHRGSGAESRPGGAPAQAARPCRSGRALPAQRGKPLLPGRAGSHRWERAGPAGQMNGAGGVEVPERVAAALARELNALPETGGELARGAAVAGESFEPELAAEAARISEPDALAAIDELLDLDVIRTTEHPPALSLPSYHRALGRLRVGQARLASGGPRQGRRGTRAPGRLTAGALGTSSARRSQAIRRPLRS